MNLHEWLRQQYSQGNISASEIARRINRARSTVHDALTMDRDPGYSLVVAMAEAAREILAEQDQTENRAESEPDQSPSESPVPAGEACA